jgi:hypothetical protein
MKQVFLSFCLIPFVALSGWAEDRPDGAESRPDKPAVAKDTPASEGPETSPLEELGWLVGRWVDDGGDIDIVTTCAWTKNRKFLTRSFVVTRDEDGEVDLEGTQVIGWDASEKRIRSWTFDSEGGFGQGVWVRDGNRWLAKKSFVLPTGEKATAVNVLTYVDDDTLRWQSVSREVAGQLLPNIPEVTVVRQPETPDTSDTKNNEEGSR